MPPTFPISSAPLSESGRSDLPATLQNLAPESARFCLDAERFLTRELGVELAGRTVLVGFSGGADSTALLLALRYLAARLRITLRAAHLDHGLRPESATEADAVRSVCRLLGVPVDVERVDVAALARERGVGLEEAGRAARYDFFDRVREVQDHDPGGTSRAVVALAHTLNDLAEDVLMRLLRGAGWPALGGMAAWDPDRDLVRPLLLTSRVDIETFVRSCGLAWTDDPSNTDPVFLRNRVRRDLLPWFLTENPNFLDTIASLWRMAGTDAVYFDTLLEGIGPFRNNNLKKHLVEDESRKVLNPFSTNEVRFSVSELDQLAPAVRLRLFKKALESLGGGQPLVTGLRNLEDAYARRAVGRVFQFPGAKLARIESHGVVFSITDK